jgi:uncharacterized protein (TIGR03382 family)
MSRILGVALALSLAAVSPASASPVEVVGRPRDVMVYQPGYPSVAAVTSNTIFLNRCPAGCQISPGGDDATAPDNSATSSLVHSSVNLAAYAGGDTNWNAIVACMKDVFSPFNVQIVDTRPSGSYLEIWVAGTSGEAGMGANIGGVAPFRCQSFQSNATVFAFANSTFYGNGTAVSEICATAAQEIAHTWALDHSTNASDPMTYFSYSNPATMDRRYYANSNDPCGSDCVMGQGPFGQPCTGQMHACACNGANGQNTYQTILALFGAGTAAPPTVTINHPKEGASVAPGFAIDASVVTANGFQAPKADFYFDDVLVSTETTQPFVWNGPATISNGTHKAKVVGYDVHGTSTTTTIEVIVGPPCQKPSDCPNNTDTCVGGRCVPGPGVQGGLGTTCNQGTDCASGQCASDGTNKYCVEVCMKGQCPSGFGCLDSGMMNGMGVCWPGFNDGSGGCSSTGAGGPITFGLGFAALVLARRRRRT